MRCCFGSTARLSFVVGLFPANPGRLAADWLTCSPRPPVYCNLLHKWRSQRQAMSQVRHSHATLLWSASETRIWIYKFTCHRYKWHTLIYKLNKCSSATHGICKKQSCRAGYSHLGAKRSFKLVLFSLHKSKWQCANYVIMSQDCSLSVSSPFRASNKWSSSKMVQTSRWMRCNVGGDSHKHLGVFNLDEVL